VDVVQDNFLSGGAALPLGLAAVVIAIGLVARVFSHSGSRTLRYLFVN
jgi:hypothetical protein